jgi:RHS repeat-associated protein
MTHSGGASTSRRPAPRAVYAYDGDNLVEETNATGGAVARYEQTQNIDEPLAMLRSSATSYYHADGLGSVTSLSSAAGSIANTYTYDSFGKLTASTGSLVNPFQYTARESDTETGLYYYRARYYDPNAGRFLSEDPLGFDGGMNSYAYVQNGPIDSIDPTGLKQAKCDQHPCDEKYPLNKTYLDFIRAHLAEAAAMAAQLNVPVENILGLSGLESQFGDSRIAREDNDFFGLHTFPPSSGRQLPGQIGVDTAHGTVNDKNPVYLPKFANPGFANSGAAFVQTKGGLVQGMADPSQFLTILHNKGGYGVGRSGYVGDVNSVINRFRNRLKCLGNPG